MRWKDFAHEEELRRFPDRYIDSVKSPDGSMLQSNREMRDAVWVHFRDRFARCPDLPLQEFRCYFADFPCLEAAKAASCEDVIIECEVRDALKQVGLNKSPGLDSLPNEVYLRVPHMFVPILTDMFNQWICLSPTYIGMHKGPFKGHKRSPSAGRSISGSLNWLVEIDGPEANTKTDSKTSRSKPSLGSA